MTYWIWLYRIAAIGTGIALGYLCAKSIQRTVKTLKEIRKLKKEKK